LDNIGVFDRSKPLPTGGQLVQADGTAWMAFYCSTMLEIALELAEGRPGVRGHRVEVLRALSSRSPMPRIISAALACGTRKMVSTTTSCCWIAGPQPLRLRSMVGIIPLVRGGVHRGDRLAKLPGFAKRTRWFLENRKDLVKHISYLAQDGATPGRRMLAIPSKERLSAGTALRFRRK
jgi:hypothetical protein